MGGARKWAEKEATAVKVAELVGLQIIFNHSKH